MNKSKIFKGFALFNFIVLLTTFLLYRNGSFDNFIFGNNISKLISPNGGAQAEIFQDSVLTESDTLRKRRLSSSKSLVIIDNIKFGEDTGKSKIDTVKINLTEEMKKKLMYSSKSGLIIDPKIFTKDSLNQEKRSQKKKSK